MCTVGELNDLLSGRDSKRYCSLSRIPKKRQERATWRERLTITTYVRKELVIGPRQATLTTEIGLAFLLTCLHTLAHTRLSCCVAYLQQQVLMLVRSTSVWLPRSQVHTTAFSFSIAQRAALHPLALLYSSTSNDCCVTVLQVSVMACRVASLQAFGVRSPPSLYVPSISLSLVPMFDSHWQCVLL